MNEAVVLRCGWKGCGDRAGAAAAVPGGVELEWLRRSPAATLRLEAGARRTTRTTRLRTTSKRITLADPRWRRRRPGATGRLPIDVMGWACPGCGRKVRPDPQALARGLAKAKRRGRPATVILRADATG